MVVPSGGVWDVVPPSNSRYPGISTGGLGPFRVNCPPRMHSRSPDRSGPRTTLCRPDCYAGVKAWCARFAEGSPRSRQSKTRTIQGQKSGNFLFSCDSGGLGGCRFGRRDCRQLKTALPQLKSKKGGVQWPFFVTVREASCFRTAPEQLPIF